MISARIIQRHEWRTFRAMRLQAIKEDARFFWDKALNDKRLFNTAWKELCTPTRKQAMFGLFDDDKLVGISMARMTDKGLLFGGSWIDPAYRNSKCANALYKARVDWFRNASRHTIARVFHRAGNGKSLHLNRKNGGMFDHAEMMRWADGKRDYGYWYRIPLAPKVA